MGLSTGKLSPGISFSPPKPWRKRSHQVYYNNHRRNETRTSVSFSSPGHPAPILGNEGAAHFLITIDVQVKSRFNDVILSSTLETSNGKALSLYYRLYNVLLTLGLGIGFPVFCPYVLLNGSHRRGLSERLGFITLGNQARPGQVRIWLHAASVGEVQAARALLPALKERFPGAVFLVSTITEQGRAVARSQLGKEIDCFLAPLDLPFAVNRAVRRVKANIYICLETELWPNLLRQLKRDGTRVVLLNGRISERSFARYLKISGFMKEVLASFNRISVIQESDAEKFAALGFAREKITINGNVKYDNVLPDGRVEEKYRQLLGLSPAQPVLIAGSTHAGEEQVLAEVHRQLRHKWPDLVCLIAPRHLPRLPEIVLLLEKAGHQFDLLSELTHRQRRHSIVLVNTMGELANLYAIGTFIFCGGSLVDYGGHNIMEAAAWGKPVFYGPYMKDFADAKELLEAAGAGFKVDSATSLSAAILALGMHPDRYAQAALQAEAAVRRQQGSARRQAALAAEVINI
jgi:3-deoxy-D-manno-octulosonic-acid transferase